MKKCGGSTTIETAIYLTAVIFICMFFIYLIIIFSYKAMVDSALEEVIDSSSLCFDDDRLSMENGKMETENEISIIDDLYVNLFKRELYTLDLLKSKDSMNYKYSSDDTRINRVLKETADFLYEKIDGNFIRPENLQIDIKLSNTILNPYLEIDVTVYVKLPIISLSGYVKGIKMQSNKRTYLDDPQAIIRNIDLMIEYFDKLKNGINIDGLVSKFGKGSSYE